MSCVLCNSNDSKIVCTKAGMKRGESQNITNAVCLKCGLIYNDPMPSDEILEKYYTGGYVEDKSGTKDNFQAFIERIKKRPVGDKNKEIVDFLKPFIKNEAKVLDIGCSSGVLLAEIRKMTNARVTGVEPDATMVRVAKEYYGIEDMENIFFEDFIKKNNEKFDLVILRHVLEHLKDPNKAVEELKDLLSDGGYLFLVMPNAANFRFSRSLAHNLEFGHLYSYTPHSLCQLLKKHGLKIIKRNKEQPYNLQMIVAKTEDLASAVDPEEVKDGAVISSLIRRLKI